VKAFQAFNTKHGKYLHEMPELFGGWSKAKGPKKMYSRPSDARSALSNVMCDQPKGTKFVPEDWEIHTMEFHIANREPFVVPVTPKVPVVKRVLKTVLGNK